jgi:hypothetical protein
LRVASAGLCARSNHARRSANAAASRSSSHFGLILNSGRPIRTASLFKSRASVESFVIKPVNVGGGQPLQAPEDFGLRSVEGAAIAELNSCTATIALGDAHRGAGSAGPWRIALPRLPVVRCNLAPGRLSLFNVTTAPAGMQHAPDDRMQRSRHRFVSEETRMPLSG